MINNQQPKPKGEEEEEEKLPIILMNTEIHTAKSIHE
jgi:hypothetical protein